MEILNDFLAQDKIYQKDMQDAKMLEQRYEKLAISDEDRIFINDYIACMASASERKCEVAFKVGKLLGELSSQKI